MQKISAALLGATLLLTVVASVASPAYALGNCGRNGHRDRWGHCVFGGQNEDYCLRTTGHPGTRMPNGTVRCFH
ncbi:MAG TPA: hypothetical protein VGL58_04460 [Caulobacteraceae bacterium]